MIAHSVPRPHVRFAAFSITTLDRYMISELAGPLFFGFSAFLLIFVAANLLALSRLVTEEHARMWAVIEYFVWGLPAVIPYVVPMAVLLGVLLAMQRLSGESEIIAMKAGGISLERVAVPLLVFGFLLSLLTFYIEETVVPLANDRATEILQMTIKRTPLVGANLTVYAPLPGGGRQLTAATGYDVSTHSLLNVTVVQYDRTGTAQTIIFANRARAQANTSWTFAGARTYRFNPDGSVIESREQTLVIDIGEGPTNVLQRAKSSPQDMSRTEIAQIIRSGQLNRTQLGQYVQEYQSQLARPFACLVFSLLAVPFGIRRVRGGGTSVGFGLAVAIVFAYYVVMTISNSVGAQSDNLAGVMAWLPNIIFFALGLVLLRRASFGAG
jgi:lipopolysaccharide export system permease protein